MARRHPFRRQRAAISRRQLLIGGGVGAGLLIAWGLWPRSYRPSLNAAPGETVMGAWLKIDAKGQVIVAVPQAELGQGVYTLLPQILAGELGADWRTVAVQPAPISPLYANSMLAEAWLENGFVEMLGGIGDWAKREYAVRGAMMLTGGGTSVRMFGNAYREAGAAARVLLTKAAAARWGVGWESLDIRNGLVTDGKRVLRLGELAEDAAGHSLPDILPLRQGDDDVLAGTEAPRLDLPAKVDGSANYAADIRLPDMVFASIRQGPIGNSTLTKIDEAAARKVTGFLKTVRTDRWVAVAGTNWWAANKALDALDPEFNVAGPLVSSERIARALEGAFAGRTARRIVEQGDLASVFDGAHLIGAEYRVAPALHLAMEPMAATARVSDAGAEVWMPTQAPAFARAAIARALDMGEEDVTLYPLMAGGSFDRRFDADPGVQAALVARDLGRPVQLMWSRAEDVIQDRPRPAAIARMTARIGHGGVVSGWAAKIACASAGPESWARFAGGASAHEASAGPGAKADRLAVSGAQPPYAIRNVAIDHYPCDTGLHNGLWRANGDGLTCFFNECFIDELASVAGIEAVSFRMQMLGGNPRLAHCLSTVAALGGWQGGISGSGQGIACHATGGSMIAVLVEASLSGGRITVPRIVAAVDCGAQVNPEIVRQQVEGGLIFGLASATGASVGYEGGLPVSARFGEMGLPRLADIGEVTVQIIPSVAAPGGISEIGVPAMAPALANALHTLTGGRYRTLPLMGDE